MLNTTYTVADVYDYDRGLTPDQIRYLAEGVVEQERRGFGHLLRVISAGAPLLLGAVAGGFSGEVRFFEDQRLYLERQADYLITGVFPQTVEEPQDDGTAPPAKRRLPPPPQRRDAAYLAAASHPMFAANGYDLLTVKAQLGPKPM